jgi:hypothetical protein
MVLGKNHNDPTDKIIDDYLKAEKNKDKPPVRQLKEMFDIIIATKYGKNSKQRS